MGFQSPLRLAIIKGNITVIRLLLTYNKLKINTRYLYKDSLLYLAIKRGNINIVELLVE